VVLLMTAGRGSLSFPFPDSSWREIVGHDGKGGALDFGR